MTAVTSDGVFHAFASFILLSNISVMFTAYQVVNFVTAVADLGGVPRVPEPPLPSAQSVRMRSTHVVYA